ncbi:MAG: Uma2 family endonuclease [Chloroflexi bacterium AL-W]|nr:Uma2 family endonuclease [Chloroflexi bacterium AL-N1]NOK70366.1 Uma2 family endonuclease [Chloroflexi bacterium AL-N10]NOK78044.1 Uma2 family endonuclease [Chloroflexi bacterium AL-N5]NOK85143.1 Uma2 family endonuclease [Chloroflexi bacterium AL-W]NOK92132.1 Uma2 family endonuclease [Chloroflexi bacterium AL-N15]
MTITSDVLPVVTPADHIIGPPQGHWTYTDYAAIQDDGNRYEIINGVLYMAPSPIENHQGASTKFVTYLTLHVEFAGLGRVYHAPFDVELAPDVLTQPDIIVVLHDRANIITPKRIQGAPNLIVEIISPGTSGYDRREKQDAYANAGVAEYWIAEPSTQTVELLQLDGQAYRSLGIFRGQAILPSQVVPSLSVKVEQFFV